MSAHNPDIEGVRFVDPDIPCECTHALQNAEETADIGTLDGCDNIEHGMPTLQRREAADKTSVEQALEYLINGDKTTRGLNEPVMGEKAMGLPHKLTGRIPFEVVELIVDAMSQGCLATCALVCRAWYHAVVRVIYRDITVTHCMSLNSLVDFIRHDARALERLHQTEVLRIIDPIGVQPRAHSYTPTHVVPLVLGRALPNVSRLVFVSSLRPQMHHSFFFTLSVFRGVTTLELLRFRLRCFSELRQVISAFPDLRVLKLADGLMETHATAAAPNTGYRVHARTRIRLKQLVLGWDLMPSFVAQLIQWLVGSSACENLSHIAIWLWPLNISPQVDELLASVGETLLVFQELYASRASDGLCSPYVWSNNQGLKIHFAGPGLFRRAMLDSMMAPRRSVSTHVRENLHASWPDLFADNGKRHCTFTHNPCLRSLHFHLSLCSTHGHPGSAVEELLSILTAVRSTHLQTITIRQTF